ncbi:DUF3099 domain-containing protein [Microbacterium sp. cx-55]|uniref:DUF3099 domain-containing protein n=1 Tax=unclassified Microbacterium TaxID=2609290 RepID=UPI001CC1B90B|nr:MULTISPECIES: DUF3099 domain-containing protein [unclassified Microbacterium]MBZ4486488.1 DUF3099 domain-containing protein [Microbacterium sp. cx-55]MCC4907460.1 DUF3099 domain-containing protein [Microbacterium sp. cx-59]UGB36543.1 DUF3099 domain-containing protein [Microbacterium sp. cx-55]
MKKASKTPQSATSLPRAPREDEGSRVTKYMITMGIRIACFIAMALVTPYGWYTWVFAAGAVFLPYIAVVIANVGEDTHGPEVINPERMLEAPAPRTEAAAPAAPAEPMDRVIRITETPLRKPEE